MITKPLLASEAVPEKIKFPVLASPKLDGIRCLKINGEVVSRKFKPIQNAHIYRTLKNLIPEGADGEIICGDTFQQCSSAVMKRDGTPDFIYYWFDWVFRKNTSESYHNRIQRMISNVFDKSKYLDSRVRLVLPVWIYDMKELREYEETCIDYGYEGIMIRDPEGRYKCGRSTVNEGILLKVKRFADSEGKVVGFVEMMHNLNEAKKDAFGRTERSSSKDGKVPAGTLGKLLVEDDRFPGHTIELGTGLGLTHELRQAIWDNQSKYIGQLAKYKYQESGMKDKPRFPIFLGFRHEDDL